MTSYTYSLSIDFTTSNNIGLIRFINDVRNNVTISQSLASIEISGDNVIITFTNALTVPEKSALDAVVANHISGDIFFSNDVIIRDIKSTGTNGGTFTSGAWQTRDLNTLEGKNPYLWITLSSNTFTLKEGTYLLTGTIPNFNVGDNQTRIYNTTTNTPEFYSVNCTSGSISQSSSKISGIIIVPSGKNSYILQHFCQKTQISDGFGIANGFDNSETYSVLNIKRI